MTSVIFEIVFILLLLVANGLLAMAEMAVVSARKAKLQQWANEGDKKARAALELANAPGSFLSTIQIGITLIGILTGAYGGATIAEQLAAGLNYFPALAPYSPGLALAIVVLVITFFSLIIGELAPKRIALHSPERIAAALAFSMRRLSVIASPFARLLDAATEGVMRLLGMRERQEMPITQEEIKILIEQGIKAGVFKEEQQEMIEGVFHLGERRAGGLMTKRADIVWIDINDSLSAIRQKLSSSTHSRFPVSQGSSDNVLGVIQTKDLLLQLIDQQSLDLKASLQPPLFVPETMPAFKVLEVFKESRIHLALVVDEYGGIEGLVTINDILEAILGDLPALNEPIEQPVVQREDGSWLLDGMLPVDDFKELFGLRQLPGNGPSRCQTLSGFVMTRLGRIPSTGEHFEWGGLRFEVVDMDGRRIDKVLVIPIRVKEDAR